MDKIIEVKEYYWIVREGKFRTNGGYEALNNDRFNALERFIREFNGNKGGNDKNPEFMQLRRNKTVGNYIYVQKYVGLIQLSDGFQIQILPKISFSPDKDTYKKDVDRKAEEDRTTRIVLLHMIDSLTRFRDVAQLNSAALKPDNVSIYEIFIDMYLQKANDLVMRGLKANYEAREDNLKFLKGKLLTTRHALANAAHKERFYVSYDEFSINIPENRIVKATLEKLSRLTGNAENARKIRRLLGAFDMVESSKNFHQDFSHYAANRNNREYEMLMQWSKVFLMNNSFTPFSGEVTARSLLFPMDQLYESYVTQYVSRVFEADGWSCSAQDNRYHLFEDPDPPSEWWVSSFKITPDIVLEKEDNRTIIMDAKWKELDPLESKYVYTMGIDQRDMYQMYVYSKKYNASEVWLLYPMTDAARKYLTSERKKRKMSKTDYIPIEFKSDDGVSIKVHFVDLDYDLENRRDLIEDSINILKKQIE